ncbi:MAG: 4-phosphoerythronate dehydrogenase [Alistipes sp.]|nr:4-phosphoerythronate dehydrogenase [Alistipes sp.]
MKVVVDSAIPYLRGVLEPYFEVVYRAGETFAASDVADADALIVRTRTKCNANLLQGSRVRLIATATIGFDHIDMDYCQKQGIRVVTAQGCNAAGVLQWVAAAMALLAQKDGWSPAQKTLGIVGVGNVGSLVEKYARRWGFNVLCCDPPRQQREGGDFVGFEELLRRSDIVTLHTPLDKTTFHMMDSVAIAMMSHNGVIINASRGEVADTQALLEASQTLILDVWEREPAIDAQLLEKALVATPHIAGYSAQGKANASSMVVRAIAEEFNLPIEGWYPAEVEPVERQPIEWEQMCRTIGSYCDLKSQSEYLKSNSREFESIRNNYDYRQEYF